MKLNREKMTRPKIHLTKRALKQAILMQQSDFTLKGQVLRTQITGKECDGFRYSIGFTGHDKEDFILSYTLPKIGKLEVALDPFIAFYAQEGKLDYLFDPSNGDEGFWFENFNQTNYQGKFWKNREDKIPPLITP